MSETITYRGLQTTKIGQDGRGDLFAEWEFDGVGAGTYGGNLEDLRHRFEAAVDAHLGPPYLPLGGRTATTVDLLHAIIYGQKS